MGRIVTAEFDPGSRYAQIKNTIWQYDYGVTLRMTGLDLPAAVEVHFASVPSGGESETRIGVTQDGVAEVKIPDALLELRKTEDYHLYAFVYLTDETSGRTEYRAYMTVKARPKPGEQHPDTDEDHPLSDAVQAVSAAAEQTAEDAKQTASDRQAVEQARDHVDKVVADFDQHAEGTETAAIAEIRSAADAVKEAGVNAIEDAETKSLEAVQQAKSAGVKAVDDTKTAGVKAVKDAQITAETAITKAQATGVSAIEGAVETGKRDFVTDPTLNIEGRAADAKAVGEQIGALKEDTAALQKRQNVLVGSETGNPVSCDDAFAAPLCGLHIYGKSTQDGTPSSDNPVPIVSAGDGGSVAVKVTGKNLLNPSLFRNNTYQSFDVKNDYYGINSINGYWITGIQPCLPSTTYHFNESVGGGCFYDDKKNVIGIIGFAFFLKTPAKCAYYCINFSSSETPYGTPIIATVSEPATYSPYREQLLTLPTPNGLPGIPVTSGGNYTDQNGQQWVCDEVDLERGVKVQRVTTMVFSDSSGFYEDQSSNGIRFRYACKNLKETDTTTADSSAFCSALALGKRGGTWNTIDVFTIVNMALYVRFKNINSLGELQQYLQQTPMSLVAILATPIEKPLSPAEIAAYKALTTYAPDTVAQASDGAGVKLEYQKDVNIAIKKLEDAIASMTAT